MAATMLERMGTGACGVLEPELEVTMEYQCGVEHQYTSSNEICDGRCSLTGPHDGSHLCAKCGESF